MTYTRYSHYLEIMFRVCMSDLRDFGLFKYDFPSMIMVIDGFVHGFRLSVLLVSLFCLSVWITQFPRFGGNWNLKQQQNFLIKDCRNLPEYCVFDAHLVINYDGDEFHLELMERNSNLILYFISNYYFLTQIHDMC